MRDRAPAPPFLRHKFITFCLRIYSCQLARFHLHLLLVREYTYSTLRTTANFSFNRHNHDADNIPEGRAPHPALNPSMPAVTPQRHNLTLQSHTQRSNDLVEPIVRPQGQGRSCLRRPPYPRTALAIRRNHQAKMDRYLRIRRALLG
jgi:hypothetical protein